MLSVTVVVTAPGPRAQSRLHPAAPSRRHPKHRHQQQDSNTQPEQDREQEQRDRGEQVATGTAQPNRGTGGTDQRNRVATRLSNRARGARAFIASRFQDRASSSPTPETVARGQDGGCVLRGYATIARPLAFGGVLSVERSTKAARMPRGARRWLARRPRGSGGRPAPPREKDTHACAPRPLVLVPTLFRVAT